MSILMELELGLALPNQKPMMVKGLDLMINSKNNHSEIQKMKGRKNQKRGYKADETDFEVESKALSLFLWSGQPNEDDDDRPEKWRKLHLNSEVDEANNPDVVGWPPISSLRKEFLHSHQGGNWAARPLRNSMYVKVKMEGVAIGRKINLRLYNFYTDLTNSLINMFGEDSTSDRDYTIMYQDKEGDWMVARDVPWDTFIESVQRMEILRN